MRSKSQVVAGVGFGIVVAALGLFAAAQATGVTGKLGMAIGGLVIGGVLVAIFARSAVVVRDERIVIRNPFGTKEVRWENIAGFRIGRYRLLSAVCLVDVTDGSTLHAFAIQVPHARLPSESREATLIASLNERARAHRRRGA